MEKPRKPGDSIGPYLLKEPLGEGGMGEVWKAADTRLGRTVAIKFAKSEFTERFEREARAVAALNHPRIAALYDVGPDYLVMEYVEGAPLQGPMPVSRALAIAGQICDALAAAHGQGIVHRDLKPANILLTRQGIKLLDFGVAKFDTARIAGHEAETVTGEHVFVGTPNYMAPEQLENREADARSDIFALGCVVYELIAGERAFTGKSVASVASAVLSTEPVPLTQRQPLTPPSVEAVLRRCLAKDPGERWQSALDVKFAFEQALETAAGTAAPRRKWGWAAIGAVAAAAIAIPAAYWFRPAVEAPLYHLELDAPGGLRIAQHSLSPDGRRIAFVAASDTAPNQVWLRALDSASAVPLPGTEEARAVYWAPNSRSIVFIVPGALMRQSLGIASQPAKVCDLPQGFAGVLWLSAETILLTIDGRLSQVPASGGVPAPFPGAGSDERQLLTISPGVLSGGGHFFSFVIRPQAGPALAVTSVDGKSRKFLELAIPGAAPGRYVRPAEGRPGYLLLNSQGVLYAQAFDESSQSLEGAPQLLVEGLPIGLGGVSVSQTGTLAYPLPDPLRFAWLDTATGRLEDLGEEGPRRAFHLSPRGDRIYFAGKRHGQQGIWAMDPRRPAAATLLAGLSQMPRNFALSRDGSKILFADRTDADGVLLREVSVNGGDPRTLVKLQQFIGDPMDWSPDGNFALLGGRGGNALLRLAPDEKPQPLRAGSAHASFSPDGRWIAWFTQDSGRPEVFVQSASSAAASPVVVSPEDTRFPRWRADGQALYVVRDGRLHLIPLRLSADSLQPAEPVPVVQTPLELSAPTSADSARYALTADGRRALLLTASFSHAREGLQVVLNWPRLLRRP